MTDIEIKDKTTPAVEVRLSNDSNPIPRRLYGTARMAASKTLGERARDCVSQDTGVAPPEMRAAQLAEATRRERAIENSSIPAADIDTRGSGD
jgi:hypothetical protein